MGFSYSGDPETSTKDAVRFFIGDTCESEPLLHDGEIFYLLRLYGDGVIQTSIRACETIMAKFARLVDESVGDVKLSYSQRIKGYQEMRDELRQRLTIEDCTPFAGGISKNQVKLTDQNHDRVKPDFTKHMMENRQISPWVTGQDGKNQQEVPPQDLG